MKQEDARRHVIQVRVNEREMALIQMAAERNGSSMSEWLRLRGVVASAIDRVGGEWPDQAGKMPAVPMSVTAIALAENLEPTITPPAIKSGNDIIRPRDAAPLGSLLKKK